MKTKLHILAILIFSANFLFAQETEPFVCGTIEEETNTSLNFSPFNSSAYSGSVDPEYLASFEPISFNIFFWIIKDSNGISYNPLTYDDVLLAMNELNNVYSQFNICFRLKGVKYINDDYLHVAPYLGSIVSYATANGYVEPNSFNCYVPKKFINRISGQGDPNKTKLTVHSYTFTETEYNSWSTLIHEIGHNFDLRHTHSGCENVTRDPNDPNYNALTHGDRVHDTNAVPNFIDTSTDPPTYPYIDYETCSYFGSQTDCQGTPYIVSEQDSQNYMSYTPRVCQNNLTIGQGIRIREAIQEDKHGAFAQAMTTNIDLYIKDSPEDLGIEPNTISQYSWKSEDIWIRNQNDGIEEHQNPEYHPTNPNYIYVRVSNRGCGTSVGDEKLNLYWAKASPSLSWDYSWNEENTFPNGKPVGGKITTANIPPVAPNESVIVAVPWGNIPNPSDYDDVNEDMDKMYWHFCLLAQIEAENDPITDPNPTTQSAYLRNNNNVAQKNITIVDLVPNSNGKALISGVIAVGNVLDTPKCYSLEFVADGNEMVKEAEIGIELDNTLQTIWEKGGKQEYNILSSRNTNKLIIKGDKAQLKNLCFNNRRDIGTLSLKFNFLTQEVSEKQNYTLHVIQKDENDEIIGGETYQIRKPPRPLFYANATNVQADKSEIVTLSAESINEPAIYNWYDIYGNFVCEGLNFETYVSTSEKYKLEVIALSDGYKDYTEAKIGLKPNRIEMFYPNPTSNLVTINYKVNKGETAYIKLVKIYPATILASDNVYNNHALDINSDTKTLDLRNYSDGLYKLILVVDEKISDTKTLLKN